MSGRDVGASVRQRLLNQSRAQGRPFQELLQYFAMERFLYRLSKSASSDRFILKGALLLTAWRAPQSRPTMDIDLAGRTSNELNHIAELVGAVCEVVAEPDGVDFNRASIEVSRIKFRPNWSNHRHRAVAAWPTLAPLKWRTAPPPSTKEPPLWEKKPAASPWLDLFRPPLARRTFLTTALATCMLFAYWGLNTWLPGFLSAPRSQGGAGLNILHWWDFSAPASSRCSEPCWPNFIPLPSEAPRKASSITPDAPPARLRLLPSEPSPTATAWDTDSR